MNTRALRPAGLSILCAATLLFAAACSPDWPMFRHNIFRTGQQLNSSPLTDPAQVATLTVRWTFTDPNSGSFRASPVLSNGRVFIGSSVGRFYAIDANTGALLWTYPAPPAQALTSTFTCNPSSNGIASAAAMATIGGTEAVIFGAPDRSIGTLLGESRLFALNAATGAEIWKSPVIGRLTNTGTIFHEQIGYSSPLVFGDSVYVGIGDHCDNPIQKGRVAKVLLASGLIDGAFSYCSTGTCADSTRGGGVWSPNAGFDTGVFVTTGNTKSGAPTEPSPNHGLSLLRLNQASGAIQWAFQPVPWALDGDPDWSAPPTVVLASCKTMIASTQKDGWTHALDAATGARQWSFPPPPAGIPFSVGDGTTHGDTRYSKGAAAWGDVLITLNGGLNLLTAGATAGYTRLAAFNVCASPATPPNLLRWLVDIPGAVPDGYGYAMGSPTVTGGMVFVGTSTGRFLAIADPSIYPSVGFRCANPDIPNASCLASGSFCVPQPAIVRDLTLVGSMVRSEPILAGGRVYVSTDAGKVYMLSP